MKTIIGSAIGILAIGLILIGAGLRGSAAPSAPAGFASYGASPANALPVADGIARTAAGGPVMVNCGAGQRALVRQVMLNGEAVSQVACVADASAGVMNEAYGAPMAQPVSYNTSTGFRDGRTSDLTQRRVVYQQPATQRVVVQKQRSWKKPLLVIGGSTAAGAGIGGLVGGKKGALIGAALGGGASTIFEATRK